MKFCHLVIVFYGVAELISAWLIKLLTLFSKAWKPI